MIFLIIFGGLLGLILCYLGVIIFFPVLSVKPQTLVRSKKKSEAIPDCRKDVEYSINGEEIRSWLYLPENAAGPFPCVVLSNGFGGTKDLILEQYALRFAEAGIAALALEYRHFGESDGHPRQLYSSIKQEEDIKATVEYLR